MKVLDNLILRWAERVHQKQIARMDLLEEAVPTPRRGRNNKTSMSQLKGSIRRVEHNYDDESVINFKIYGASGGMIVETSRYDDKKDNESIRRYVIDETANVGESIGRIVTLEYLR